MAQTTRSSRTRSSRSGSRTRRSTSGNGSSRTARSSSRRTSSNAGSRRTTASAARRASSNGPLGQVGGTVTKVASKAKAPLIAGGAALAGLAGGVALKSRDQNRRPLKRLSSVQLPKSVKNLDLGKLDMDKLTKAARRVQSIGEQVGDVADAAEKTRKKHK